MCKLWMFFHRIEFCCNRLQHVYSIHLPFFSVLFLLFSLFQLFSSLFLSLSLSPGKISVKERWKLMVWIFSRLVVRQQLTNATLTRFSFLRMEELKETWKERKKRHDRFSYLREEKERFKFLSLLISFFNAINWVNANWNRKSFQLDPIQTHSKCCLELTAHFTPWSLFPSFLSLSPLSSPNLSNVLTPPWNVPSFQGLKYEPNAWSEGVLVPCWDLGPLTDFVCFNTFWKETFSLFCFLSLYFLFSLPLFLKRDEVKRKGDCSSNRWNNNKRLLKEDETAAARFRLLSCSKILKISGARFDSKSWRE